MSRVDPELYSVNVVTRQTCLVHLIVVASFCDSVVAAAGYLSNYISPTDGQTNKRITDMSVRWSLTLSGDDRSLVCVRARARACMCVVR